MTTTTNLGITLIEQSQSQKEATMNEALTTLDAMVNNSVISKSTTTPPGAPASGDAYIVPTSATGAWAGQDTKITYFNQAWRFIIPKVGALMWVRDELLRYQFNGTAWVQVASGDMLKSIYDAANIAQQVVGTTATQTLTNKTISGASNTLTVRLGSDVTGTLPVAGGGTGQSSYTDGQLLIGNSTGNTLAKTTLTAGSGINITNGAGSITIAAPTPTITMSGDVTGTQAATVVGKLNGTALSSLATGILKNTTTTGVPTIAAAGTDYQAPITLTTTGTSGAATFVSNTLNIPNYAGGGSSAFSAITGSTNTTAAMVVGTGASIAATGSGAITATSVTGASTITSAAATALVVGANGATNPALTVDASTASSTTGLLVKSAAAAAGLAVSVQSSGTNENLTINAKGSGTISIGSVSTGTITLTRATTMSAGATVSGTSTLTGAITHTAGNFSSTNAASGTAAGARFGFTGAADTALTASTEAPSIYFNAGQTRQHATGALTLQRDMRVSGSTHSAVAASTITNAAAFAVDGACIAGTNATLTNSHAIYVPGSAVGSGTTNSYGLTINANSGATNNYAAQFMGGNVGIGTATPDVNALLDVSSTTKAFLPPRMSTTQKNAISSPTAGLVVYDNTLSKLSFYNGSSWDVTGAAAGTFMTPLTCEGRVTLTSGTPVTTADVTAATTMYFTPFKGSRVALYDGSSTWTLLSFTQTSFSVPATTNTNYDVFAYNNAGTLALETLAWTNDTTRATALVFQDGVYVKTGATTRRYLGTFRTTGTSGQTEDSKAKRFVWNYYNRVKRLMTVSDATTSWTYSTATYRQANANSANQLALVIGVAEDVVDAAVYSAVSNSTTTARTVIAGLGVDSLTTASLPIIGVTTIGTSPVGLLNQLSISISAGYHYIAWLECGDGTDTQSWYGTSAKGLFGSVWS